MYVILLPGHCGKYNAETIAARRQAKNENVLPTENGKHAAFATV